MTIAFDDRFWTAADGTRLHARDYAGQSGLSRKAPALLLHGLTRNARDFEAVAPWVAAQGRRVLAVDVRGRGASAPSPDPAHYAVPVYVGDVLALMAQASLERVAVIGTSMGGLIGMTLACLYPDRVTGLLMNDIGPEIDPKGLARIMGYAGGTADPMSWEETVAYARRTNGAAFPRYGRADWERFARRLVRPEDDRFVLDYDPAIAAPQAPSAAPPDLWPVFEAAARDRPLGVVRGALSDILSEATAQRMRTSGPDVRLVEIAGVGHAPTLEEPEAATAMLDLLERAL